MRIFSPVCLLLSSLLLVYTFYKSEIYWTGQKIDYYLFFYCVSFALIIFSFFSFYLSKKIKEYLIIITISIFTTIYLFELYLIFKKQSHQKSEIYKKETGFEYDTRTKLEIYEDKKKINSKVTLAIPPSTFLRKNYELFPLSGVSNSETIFCNENGNYSIYDSDRYGFNNPDEEWNQKEIEYLLVGDSFTHGACVSRPNDIASILRILSNKSVLNLGYEDNGPLIEYAILREYLNPNIKKVLWIYYEENDFRDLAEELPNKILKNYLYDSSFSQDLKSKQNIIDGLLKTLLINEEKKSSFDISKFVKVLNIRLLLTSRSEIKQKPQPEFKKILKLAKDLISKNNSKLYFVYLPQYNRYKSNFKDSNYYLVKDIVDELDIPFIDIHTSVFKKEENPLKLFPFELFGHYTEEGYKKVSKSIYKFTK